MGTLLQELNSLEPRGEPDMVQKRRNSQAPTEVPEETEKSNCCPTG